MNVPNKFPASPSSKRIALIGEAPGHEEVVRGEPFIGASGRFLAVLLRQAGTSRETCFLGNVCQEQPPGNEIGRFDWYGPQIRQGLEQLRVDLQHYNPNIVVLLGNIPLREAKDPKGTYPTRVHVFKNSNWRGSLFVGHPEGVFAGRKCLSTLHPAYCLRDRGQAPLLLLDLKKAVREASSPELVLPPEKVIIPSTADEAVQILSDLMQERRPLATDIEGGLSGLRAIAFAATPEQAYVIPFLHTDGRPWWHPSDEVRIFRALATLMENPLTPKLWQNGLYDRFVLHYGFGIRCRGNRGDIMLKHWELNSELAKGENNEDRRKKGLNLALQTSIYTNRPYYKDDIGSADDMTFLRYNARDAMVTKEIDLYLDGCLRATCSKTHYRMNNMLLNAFLYMELRGIRYDSYAARERRDVLSRQLYMAQARLNCLTGHTLDWRSTDAIFRRVRDLMGLVRKPPTNWDDLCCSVKKPYVPAAYRLRELVHASNPDLATIGEIENLCEVSLNVESSGQVCDYLYNALGLPKQYNENPATGEPTLTADYEALLKLARELQKNNHPSLPIVHTLIEIRALQKRCSMLEISADRDGRVRSGYNIVGSNTGRVTCYTSPTGSGYNLQTIPAYSNKADAPGGVLGDRDLFLADEGYWFFQCDLKGADGWTVAAYCATLGDRVMLDDYLAGIKPYLVLACRMRGYPVNFKDRDDIKEWCKKIKKDDWDAFACKRVQHGGAYLEGDITISRNILKDSEGKLYLSPAECGAIRQFYFERYPGIPRWHDWVRRRLHESSTLTAASGQIRTFFGRPDDVLTKAVAFEPQANTTYATNLAMFRLWTDPDNRLEIGSSGTVALRVEPLHQVHDALCGQFRKEDTDWAVGKIKSWFNNPITIAGQTVVIPYDGAYGESWGTLTAGTL